MTGTTIAQAVPIAVSPILTRLYAPGDYGILALYVSLATIFGAVSNGRYDTAVMLAETDEDAINVASLGIIIAVFVSLVLLAVVVFLGAEISEALGHAEIRNFLYFIPVSVFFTGLFNILNYINTRKKTFKNTANANIFKSLLVAVVQISMGLFSFGALGLITGQLTANIGANIKLLFRLPLKLNLRETVSWLRIKQLAYRYRDFPKFTIWATLANSLSSNVVNILISTFFSVSTLGLYSISQRILGMPTVLVGTAVGQVFCREAVEEKKATGKAVKTFNSTFVKLCIISIPAFLVLWFVVEDAFALVFGENWRIAGVYARHLIPLFAIRFVASSMILILPTFEKQLASLVWQLALLAISVLLIYSSSLLSWDFEFFLHVYSLVLSFHYVVLLCLIWLVTRSYI
ncbi:oligosaccharide flippase family protein [Emcibacter nanhaiensis]|uniref:Lipopolysaccharide biosynthesis protein n=1 Tax=Emcibacter nanhaiensis TaxID=1505037 RepID=A0A501PAL3_9PROT|nr:oligosaccharide flippase family protein [Emcibacter nanhaiensis]TPD57419.1 hypothetical protein FIV46_14950 [Emcibacter nanhaiensis]